MSGSVEKAPRKKDSLFSFLSYRHVLLCIIGILLNMIPSAIASYLGLLVWLDTIGTLTTAILGGYLPGILVGLVTNLLKGFTDTTSVYYAVLNVLIAVAATFLYNRGWLKKLWTTIFFILTLSIIGGVLGGILPWVLDGFPTSGFLTDFLYDLLDKAIVVAVVIIILHFIPDKLKKSLRFRGWLQEPLTETEEKAIRKTKTRKISVRAKIILTLTVSLLILSFAATTISFLLYRNAVVSKNELIEKYAGMEVSSQAVASDELSFMIQMIFMFMGFVILIIAVAVWFVDYSLLYPINSMSKRAGEIDFEDNTQRDKAVERISTLDVHTGDEVENLYNSLLHLTSKSLEFADDIAAKTDTIAKMQTALIMVLSDLVENRDQNTGQHIRKTAAYVDLILHKMRDMGMYKDVLTDDYIRTVIRSAPLHDIGKIQVPDAILNKPGKLTEDEFEVMKTHTTAGAAVISQVLKEVPESYYLSEAANMAKYHHEKWNGKGYPEGLSGKDIPLSARVMAIADVFDALVSKRVYKPGMPLEKAFAIIKEDTGTHFDPDVSAAFLAAEKEVRLIEERFRDVDDYDLPDELRFPGAVAV